MFYGCYRGHVTNENDLPEEKRGLDFVCCPQTEKSPVHPNYGKVCGRLAFRGKTVDKPEETKV